MAAWNDFMSVDTPGTDARVINQPTEAHCGGLNMWAQGGEPCLDFAHKIADEFVRMERGAVVMAGAPGQLDEAEVRRYPTV